MIELSPIGYVESAYPHPQDTPAQATENFTETGRIVVEQEYADALLGLENYRYLWLVSWLHDQDDRRTSLRVVPRSRNPDGQPQGVFATRSPRRPNQIGLSLIRLVSVVDSVITFRGVDLVSGTPVLDIKPWWRGTDNPPDEPAD